jgi:neopullulanase
MKLGLISLVAAIPLLLAGCGTSDDGNGTYSPPPIPNVGDDSGSGGTDATTGGSDAAPAPPSDSDGGLPGDDASFAGDGAASPCLTTFSFVPPPGTTVSTLSVSGAFNDWVSPGQTMAGPDVNGAYSTSVALPVGMNAYKLLLNGNWEMDPGAWLRTFVGGVEDSAVMVADCHVPTWSVIDSTPSRPAAGAGTYVAHVVFNPGQGEPALDPASLGATLRQNGNPGNVTTLSAPTYDPAAGTIAVNVTPLADGKYTVFVSAKDKAGNAPAEPLRLVFWIEAETFDWNDALIYMTMTDRFQDGDPTNDPPPLANVDPREQYQGGDLEGITARINDGTFDALGVRALWVSPFFTGPPDAWLASDNVHLTTGYHGYWPIRAREVDPRIGGAAALTAMVTAAHAHGIRVVEDFMVADIHQEHEYFAAHPDWFIANECVCGSAADCDWTAQRLTCQFESYLPRVDWTNPAVSTQWMADAVWWVDTFDLDGFRIDAVKQIQDNAITNTSYALRHEFEASGLKFFMTGETAMGWSPCTAPDCPGNEQNYGIISEYIGPFGLDGSFDFVLYYAVPSQTFMTDNDGMQQTDYWTQASQWEYPAGSIMSPYIGSEDTARFVSLADTSGGDALANNQWTDIAGPPTTSDAYGRIQMAMAWLLTIPGAPMMYYGDEYGQYGSVDPNNRVMWRGGGNADAGAPLTANEQGVLAYTKELGTARKNVVALRRGAYVPIVATQDIDLFARQTTDGEVALVALSRGLSAESITASIPPTLGIADGTPLHDQLGGPAVTVAGGAVTLSVPTRGAVILTP